MFAIIHGEKSVAVRYEVGECVVAVSVKRSRERSSFKPSRDFRYSTFFGPNDSGEKTHVLVNCNWREKKNCLVGGKKKDLCT